MTIEMVIRLNVDQLDTYKTNLIKVELEPKKGFCGHVTRVLQQLDKDIFNCEVLVYKSWEDQVYKALAKHTKKMTN